MKRILRLLMFVIFLFMICFSGWKLYGLYSEYSKGSEAYNELANQFTSTKEHEVAYSAVAASVGTDAENDVSNDAEEMISVDFEALKAECEDVAAWLYCPGTKINYPVVQSDDNDYYLHRLMNGEYSLGGTLYMDYRNKDDFSDWNSIVYGHNMKDGSMFSVLPDYMEQEFYDENPFWYLLTENVNYRIELIGGYVTPADSDTYSFPESMEEKQILVNKASRLSSFHSAVQVQNEDKLITLSTCVYDYENARYVLVGVLRPYETAED